MHVDSWQLALGLAALLLQVSVVCVIAFRRRLGEWPSLAAALSLDALSTLALLFCLRFQSSAPYFYIYWLTSAAQSLLRIWIAVDIVRSFRSVEYLPRAVYWAAGALAASTAVSSALLCGGGHFQPHHILQPVLLLNRAVSVGWAIFFIVLLVSIRITGIGWSRLGMTIAAGLAVHLATGILVAEALTHRTWHLWLSAGAAEALVEIAILAYWLFTFLNLPARTPSNLQS